MPVVKKKPQRQCVGCGQYKDKPDMIRVLRIDDNSIILDTTGKKNGRGAYICKNPDCLGKAHKSKGLERSLKTQIPDEIYEQLKADMDGIYAG